MRAVIFIWTTLISAPTLAFAQQDCGNLSNQTEMNACAEKAFKKSDAELNALYKQIEGRLTDSPESRKLLIGSQRAWVVFRDAECAFASAGVAGGSIQPFILSTCMDMLTQKRVDDFKGYLSCGEGDLSCPVPASN